jgi:FHS family Na+ dependent glucose MFS transporter 1
LEQKTGQSSQKEIYYFITYGVSCISLGLGFASFGPLLQSLATKISVSLGTISFLFTAHSLGYLIGSSGGGRLYDRLKGHLLMVIGLAIMVIMSILIPLSPSFFLLLGSMFLFGLGQGIVDIGANVNLLWVYQSRVGPYMNGLHFFFGVGALLSPIIIHHVMKLADDALTWPFWTLAVLFLPGLLGLLTLKSPKNPEIEEIIEKPKAVNTRLLVLMILLFFIYVGVEGGIGGWIYTYITKMNIVNESNAAYMNSFFWGALTIGRLLTLVFSRKIQPSKILIINFAISAISLGLILIYPVSKVIIWVAAAGLGLGLSSVFPTLLILAETRLKITGGVTGLFFLGSSLGGMVIPMLAGQVLDFLGPYEVVVMFLGFTLIGFIVLVSVISLSNQVGEKARNSEEVQSSSS